MYLTNTETCLYTQTEDELEIWKERYKLKTGKGKELHRRTYPNILNKQSLK